MTLMVKTGVIIVIMSFIAMFVIKTLSRRAFATAAHNGIYATAGAFIALAITQPWLALLGLGGVAAFFTRQRNIAAGVAMLLIITTPNISRWWMLGSLQFIKVFSTTAVVIGLLIASFFWEKRKSVSRADFDIPAIAIVIVLTFMAARNTTFTNVLRVVLENAVAYVLPYVILRRALRDAVSIKSTFLLVAAAGLAISAISTFESIRVWPIYQAYGQMFGSITNAGVKMRGGMLRAAGPLMNPPLSSSVLALCFVTALSARDVFKTKAGHRLALIGIAVGLFMMQSRVGWLGAMIGSVGVVASRRGVKGLLGYGLAIGTAGALLYVAAISNERFGSLVGFSADAKGSSEYRDQLSARGIEIIKQHPVIGQPIEVVQVQMASLRQGEGIVDFTNAYLAIGLFAGLTGLALVVGGLILQGRNAYTSRVKARGRGAGSFADLGLGVVTAAAAMLPFVPTDYRIMLTIILLFALSNAVALPIDWRDRSRDRRFPAGSFPKNGVEGGLPAPSLATTPS